MLRMASEALAMQSLLQISNGHTLHITALKYTDSWKKSDLFREIVTVMANRFESDFGCV